jgi:hypothetical protein
MRSAARVSCAALALGIGWFSSATAGLAGPKEEVGAATLEWGQALGEDDPEKVLPFYADDAVLWAHCLLRYAPTGQRYAIIL